MTKPRIVKVTDGFFDQLDAQLGEERSPTGEPSRADFLTFVLPSIRHRFATEWDTLPEVEPGVPSARMIVTEGLLVYAFLVEGVLGSDGAIDLIGVTIDLYGPDA